MTPATVTVKNITLTFAGVDVLRNVDAEFHPGEVHAVIGENGAGKSSLGKIIAGEYRPRLGEIKLNGTPVQFKNPRQALHHGIALIHQEPVTFPDLDIAENIFVGHQPRIGPSINWKETRRRAVDILESVAPNALAGEKKSSLYVGRKVRGLSVAQQQIVELAAAMSHHAKVWIFDETTAPLTPKEVEELFGIMRNLRERGCTIAMVTHHLEEVFAIADRITVLRDGLKIAEKKPNETNAQELIQLMIGRSLSPSPAGMDRTPEEKGPGGEVPPLHKSKGPALRIENLTGPGYRNISLEIYPGEIVGLAGLVGSGRTELAKSLFGITRPTGGTIANNGATKKISNPKEARRNYIALVPEDRQHDGLLMSQDIAFNTTLAHLTTLSKKGWLNRKSLKEQTQEFVGRLRIANRALDQPVNELSGGNQQKVVLSKWLMTNPDVLILDEPTRGVDVGSKQEVHQLIREQANAGMAVLMISSDVMEILALSDRIAVMRKGEIAAIMDGTGATEEEVMSAAFGPQLNSPSPAEMDVLRRRGGAGGEVT